MDDVGRLPSAPGYSAKPEPVPVSAAVAASIPSAWRDYRLDELELSTRVRNILINYRGLTTVGEVADLSDAELLRSGNFGRVSLKEIRGVINALKARGRPKPSMLAFHVGQLRHAYALMVGGFVGDQRRFADGFLAPAICEFERFLAAQGTSASG